LANDSPQPSSLREQLSELRRQLDDRIDRISTFDATQMNRAIEKLTELVNDLPGEIDAALAIAVNTGNVNATGNVVAGGNVSGANVTGGNVFAQSLATNITAPRVTLWGRTADGFIGTASSSRRFKMNIRDSGIDPCAVLQIEDVLYNYIDEVRKRDDPEYEHYVGPKYRVATEIGAIAEQLHEIGLWQFVIYERDTDGSLALDGSGEPIPSGIHYQMLVMSVFPVLRMQQARLEDIETRMSAAGI